MKLLRLSGSTRPSPCEMVSRAMDGIDARKAAITADVYEMLLMHLIQGAVGDGVAADEPAKSKEA